MIPTLQSIKSLRLMNSLKLSLSSRNGTGLTLFPTTRNAMARPSSLYSVMANAMFQLTVPVRSAILCDTNPYLWYLVFSNILRHGIGRQTTWARTRSVLRIRLSAWRVIRQTEVFIMSNVMGIGPFVCHPWQQLVSYQLSSLLALRSSVNSIFWIYLGFSI